MDINAKCKEAYENAKIHGFHEIDNAKRDLLEIGGEVVETLIALNKDYHSTLSQTKDEVQKQMSFKTYFEMVAKDSLEDELADIVIRVFDFCGNYEIDLQTHINAKMEYNKIRPYLHKEV